MEPTAKSTKPAINDTSLLACLPEPVLELVLAAAGPRARMRSARCSRGVQDAALLPDKYWREAYTQRWWHARAALVPEKSAVAFAARVKGERACCDLLVALAESGNQLTWRQKNDCVERAGDDACELLARISAATNVYSEPHTPFGRARRSGLRPPPAPGSTAAWVAVRLPGGNQTCTARLTGRRNQAFTQPSSPVDGHAGRLAARGPDAPRVRPGRGSREPRAGPAHARPDGAAPQPLAPGA